MITLTGDQHGRFDALIQFNEKNPHYTKDDYVIVLGDFGVWSLKGKNPARLDQVDQLRFTTLFIDGNHENFNILDQLPTEDWKGGKVHRVRPSILHLQRGECFLIDGKRFFTFGGGLSQDISDGILDPRDKDYLKKRRKLIRGGHIRFRVLNESYWPREMPSHEEYARGLSTLEKINYHCDYVLTHSAPSKLLPDLEPENKHFIPDEITNYLEKIRKQLDFKKWFLGHYHQDLLIQDRFYALFNEFIHL